MESIEVPVLVIGAGPVGLATALELGWRGVDCLVVEQGDGSIIDAKMFATGIRTLEFCRRWGIAQAVKEWGFPADYPFDNVFVTSLAGHELARIPMPSVEETAPFPTSPERFVHCPQFVFDPILAGAARQQPGVDLRYRHSMTGLEPGNESVAAEIRDIENDRTLRVAARWVVGCDGFHSPTRHLLGIEMRGREKINRSLNIMFEAPDLLRLHDKGKAGRYVIVDDRGPWASLVPADGVKLWRLMVYNAEEDKVSEAGARELVERAVGHGLPLRIASIGHWVRRCMVADAYRRGRIFLAGDAVHVMPPNGGLGMNTGIGDAVDLAWKIAAVEQGWGGHHLLDSYEAERRPVGVRACEEAMKGFRRLGPSPSFEGITGEGARAEGQRREVGAALAEESRQTWENPLNVHLGYCYSSSPICLRDEPVPPEPEDSRNYVQSTFPGSRAPHVWLDKDVSTLDLFGRGFTLLRRQKVDVNRLVISAQGIGLPLTVLDLPEAAASDYPHALTLVRPDGHVAWRSEHQPIDALAVWDVVRGETLLGP